jgi:hypothetical protein
MQVVHVQRSEDEVYKKKTWIISPMGRYIQNDQDVEKPEQITI